MIWRGREMRLFIAVDIDRQDMLQRLKELEEELSSLHVPMKLVEPENFHITVRFIGEVAEYVAGEIRGRILPGLRFKPFRLRLAGIGGFPSPSNARVIWVGIVKGFDELKDIREQIDRGLREIGITLEQEEFTPHLTLARIKERGSPAVLKFIMEKSNYEIGEMEVRSVRLKKSTLTPRGPIYETLAEARV
ncbi:MAG: RNA 2',3'-cyclic phosphodiesterase [Acidilobus sp.]